MEPEKTLEFSASTPTPQNYLRSIVLFGRNVASYKFALAKSLIEIAGQGRDSVSMEELAAPFSRHLCEHLEHAPKQATSPRSRFLEACRRYNAAEIPEEELIGTTVRLGFNNVIDAFHVVGRSELGMRFFEDQRRSSSPRLVITDDLLGLGPESRADAVAETEARWRLVETAWELSVNSSLIDYDPSNQMLVPSTRRRSVTKARDALNGYQKGRCFYCFGPIGLEEGSPALAEVDHFIPHVFQRRGVVKGLDRIWNLVLACPSCNRGAGGKSDLLPAPVYLERLHQRNEYLIASHHPLRETLIGQLGTTTADRAGWLWGAYQDCESQRPGMVWSTAPVADPSF